MALLRRVLAALGRAAPEQDPSDEIIRERDREITRLRGELARRDDLKRENGRLKRENGRLRRENERLKQRVSRPDADEQEGSTTSDGSEPSKGALAAKERAGRRAGPSHTGLDRHNPEFFRALDLMRAEGRRSTGGPVFITGKAGTGKSTLIKHFLETTDTTSTIVLAPTGVAALNVRGETVHRFFHFGIDVAPEGVRRSRFRPKNAALYKELSTIVIDEASMLRADLVDCVHEFLCKHGPRPGEPFGGVRMIFVGDLYQLPPVVPPEAHAIFNGERYDTPYFFSADVLSPGRPVLVELEKVYRQEDVAFIDRLDRIRTGGVDDDNIRSLNERVGPGRAEAVCLTVTRKAASQVNGRRLDQLEGRPETSRAEIQGDYGRASDYPTDELLTFKVGARVMLVNNDSGGRWVNGSVGEVESIGHNGRLVHVRLQEGGQLVDVEPYAWERVRFALKDGTITTEKVASFKQLPFLLAWAVTINKSQGKTFENIVVDFGKGAFASGQAYVAFSRSTSLDGIALHRPIDRSDIFADPRVEDFLTACRARSA